MEIISPVPYNWLMEDTKSGGGWTAAENKQFENALAIYDKDTPDRWHNVAAMIPGRSVSDVIRKYKELEDDVSNIEAGLFPEPGYTAAAAFTLDWVSSGDRLAAKRSKPLEQERKKGVPWTEEEHKLFLMGLKKYGKGDWRNISRNFVVTRTPTQVASHAQKYFIRQLSGGKDKRRASIHDITTNNLSDPRTPSPESMRPFSPPAPPRPPPSSGTGFQWNQPSGAQMGFHVGSAGVFNVSSSPYGITSFGMKIQGHSGNNNGGSNNRESYFGAQSMVFQMQSAQSYPRGRG